MSNMIDINEIPIWRMVCKRWNTYWKGDFQYSFLDNCVIFQYNFANVKRKLLEGLTDSLFHLVCFFVHATSIDFMGWGEVDISHTNGNNNNNNNSTKNVPTSCLPKTINHTTTTKTIPIFEGYNTDDSNDAISNVGFDRWERFKIVPFLAWMLKKINTHVEENSEFTDDRITYTLLLGILYDITWLKTIALTLMKDNNHVQLRTAVMENRYDLRQNHYLFKLGSILSHCNIYEIYRFNYSIGIPGFFGICSLTGNFSFYDYYLQYYCHSNEKKISESGLYTANILPMMGLFLRRDLLRRYVHTDIDGSSNNVKIDQEIQTFIFVICVPKLEEQRENLLDLHLPVDDTLFDMDTQHYHPLHRIHFLYSLFCSHFSIGLSNNLRRHAQFEDDSIEREESIAIYGDFRKLVGKLYDSFVYFSEIWQLGKYSDLTNNLNLKSNRIYTSNLEY